MSTPERTEKQTPLDLSRWRSIPTLLIVVGGLVTIVGWITGGNSQFAFSLLAVFAFYTSIVVGSLFLVIAHHLFDASWSVATRRTCENIAVQSKWLILP